MGLLDAKGTLATLGLKKNSSAAPAGLALAQPTKGPLGGAGMPAMPGQSPLGMSVNAPPGNSLAASSGQRSFLG